MKPQDLSLSFITQGSCNAVFFDGSGAHRYRKAANVNDVTQGYDLLYGRDEVVLADAGYQGAANCLAAMGVPWQVAMRPGIRKIIMHRPWGQRAEKAETNMEKYELELIV